MFVLNNNIVMTKVYLRLIQFDNVKNLSNYLSIIPKIFKIWLSLNDFWTKAQKTSEI